MESIDDEQLIFEVKKLKNLYRKSSLGYRNKFKRAKSWAKISAVMNVDVSSVPTANTLLEEPTVSSLTEENSQSMDASFNFEPLEELSSTPTTNNKKKGARKCDQLYK